MNRSTIQIEWLNKLYDDIYYNEFKDGECALDLITELIAHKEENTDSSIETNLISAIVEVCEELAQLYENEELDDCHKFIVTKIDKIQSGDLDKELKEEYFPDFYSLDDNYNEEIDNKDIEEDECQEDEYQEDECQEDEYQEDEC